MSMNEQGHLKDCYLHWSKALRPTLQCCEMTDKGTRCKGIVCNLACIDKHTDDLFKGYCNNHWERFCDKMQWYSSISKCANIMCDKKNISLDERKTLTSNNIRKKLELPTKCNIWTHFWSKRKLEKKNAQKKEIDCLTREINKMEKRQNEIRTSLAIMNDEHKLILQDIKKTPSFYYNDFMQSDDDSFVQDNEYEKDGFVVSDDESAIEYSDCDEPQVLHMDRVSKISATNDLASRKRKALEEIRNKRNKKAKYE